MKKAKLLKNCERHKKVELLCIECNPICDCQNQQIAHTKYECEEYTSIPYEKEKNKTKKD